MKSCKPGKPMKSLDKKNTYQPPKLATKNKWIPPKDEEGSNNSSDEEVSLKKTIDSNKKSMLSKPKLESKPKSIKSETLDKKGGNTTQFNTVTTFSRLDEDGDDRNSFYNDAEDDDNRVPCENCCRKFNPDRLEIHQKSCNNMKKRKVFDSKNKRIVDSSQKFSKIKSEPSKPPKSKAMSEKKAKWRKDHDELVKAIKMSRLIKKVEMEGGDISKIPIAPSEPNEDYIECEYCFRRFAPKVADRHIPKCKDMINRPKPPPHILKKQNEKEEAKRDRIKRKAPSALNNQDPKYLTASSFNKELQSDTKNEISSTQYSFKGPLKRIPEQNEDENYKNSHRESNLIKSEPREKRGKSLNPNILKSNGFSKSTINNSTAYQSNFNEVAISTSTSKKFIANQIEHHESYKHYQRSESLIDRSATYSTVPCPHCNRKFSSAAAERHIPICKSIVNKPKTLRETGQKRSSVQLPHLSKTNYNASYENSLMNNTSSTFRTNILGHPNDQLSQTSGLPPTYKPPASKAIMNTRKDFAAKRSFCTCCGYKYRNDDKFCAMCGEKRLKISLNIKLTWALNECA